MWEDKRFVHVLSSIFSASVGIALLVFVIVEAVGFMILLIPARIKKLKDEGREEGLEEGKVDMWAQWDSWNARRMKATEQGVPFDDPPPPRPV
jgi:hypothetical protein